MSRRNRECYLCGEHYKYCSTCAQDRTKPSWMAEFHSANCVKIFQICTNFNMNTMSKEEAKTALEQCDLTGKENFKAFVQRDIENIFAEDKQPINVDAEIKEIHNDEVVVEVAQANRKAKNKSHEVVTENE